jgi:hypothetical protein
MPVARGADFKGFLKRSERKIVRIRTGFVRIRAFSTIDLMNRESIKPWLRNDEHQGI